MSMYSPSVAGSERNNQDMYDESPGVKRGQGLSYSRYGDTYRSCIRRGKARLIQSKTWRTRCEQPQEFA